MRARITPDAVLSERRRCCQLAVVAVPPVEEPVAGVLFVVEPVDPESVEGDEDDDVDEVAEPDPESPEPEAADVPAPVPRLSVR